MNPKLFRTSSTRIEPVLILLSIAYVILRYVVFGNVSPAHLPMYLLNKMICIYATGSLLLYALALISRDKCSAEKWLSRTMSTGFLHVMISLTMLHPGYYKKLFDGSQLSFTGELSMLAGVLASAVYWARYCNSSCIRGGKSVVPMWIGAAFLFLHVSVMGSGSWFDLSRYNGGLPPITLITAIPALATALILFSYWRFNPQQPQ